MIRRLLRSGAVVICLFACSLGAATAAHAGVAIQNRRIERDQTLAHALHATGLPTEQIEALIGAMRAVDFDFRRVVPGDQFRLVLRDGALDFFDYRKSSEHEWLVRRDGERLVASKRAVEVEHRVELVELTVSSSLYEAAIAAGENPAIAMVLADVFAWDIDFYQDVQKGDRARALVEKVISKGRVLRYGEVRAAQYQGSTVGKKRVFRYELPGKAASFFAEDGSSTRKSFLKSPLKFAHVTSKFGSRFHPVLKYVKAHNGVDYGAGIGTPVWAVADGTVLKAGYMGAGGNTLCLRHANGWETCYLHLSKFGAGVRAGARVSQKQVVAYTGNTGRSTGPHLHFAMKRHGGFVNPLNQNFPRAEPVPKAHLADFREKIATLATELDRVAVAGSALSATK